MRIRKRTPAGAASPGPSFLPAIPSAPPPLPLALQHHHQQPKERTHEEDDAAEQKRPILLGPGPGGREDDRDPAATAKDSAATDHAPRPEAEPPVRCSRNDGKRWRCKGAAVPGYLFCDRHVAWSTRKRKPRPKKQRSRGGGTVLGLTAATGEEQLHADDDEGEEGGDEAVTTRQLGFDGDPQPGGRKRARGDGPDRRP